MGTVPFSQADLLGALTRSIVLSDHVYEGLFILDSNRYGRDPGGVSAQIPELIQQHGGKVLASRLWEERRLAYPIGSHRKGTYWLTYFNFNADQMGTLRRQLQLNENVVRSLLLKIDPRIADALVTHALTGTGPVAEARRAAKVAEEAPAAPDADVPVIDALADDKDLPEE
jgi:small subunit ribosomal protein S6